MKALRIIGWYLLAFALCGAVGATLTYEFLRGLPPESVAGTLTVLVTVVLAYYAAQSVIAARESVAAMNESVNASKESAEATRESAEATRDSVSRQDANYRATTTDWNTQPVQPNVRPGNKRDCLNTCRCLFANPHVCAEVAGVAGLA